MEPGQPLTVPPGQHRTVTLTVTDPPAWGPGDYTLDLDLLYEVQSTGNIVRFSDGQSSAWFAHSIRIPATICIQSDCAGPNSFHLPLLAKAPPPPPPPPPTGCYVGRLLVDDPFEGGDPFSQGTDRVAGRPWIRAVSQLIDQAGHPIAGPHRASIEKRGETDNDAIRFINFQRDYDHQTNAYDQAFYKEIWLPDNTAQFTVTFDLMLVTEEPLPGEPDHTGDIHDRLFFDVRLDEAELLNGNYTSGELVQDPACHHHPEGTRWSIRSGLL